MPTLLKISGFCQNVNSHLKDSSHVQQGKHTENYQRRRRRRITSAVSQQTGLSVSISILTSLPQHVIQNSSQYTDLDIYATVYTESYELLRELQVFDGQVCKLSSVHCVDCWDDDPVEKNLKISSCRNRHPCVPVILKYLNTHEKNYSNDDEYTILVPPILSGMISIYNTHHVVNSNQKHRIENTAILSPIVYHDGISNTKSYIWDTSPPMDTTLLPPLATKATLEEIGIPSSEFLPTFMDLPTTFLNHGNDDDSASKSPRQVGLESKRIQLLQNYFSTHYNLSLLSNFSSSIKVHQAKRFVGRLVTKGSIVAIVNHQIDDDDTVDDDGELKSGYNSDQVLFYKVVDIQNHQGHLDLNFKHSALEVYLINSNTELSLTSRHGVKDEFIYSRTWRLPQRSLIQSFDYFIQELYTNTIEIPKMYREYKNIQKFTFHPSVNKIVATLLSNFSTRNENVFGSKHLISTQMLHLVGCQDDHVDECLDCVADIVGMNIFHVRGLAAFSYRCSNSSSLVGADVGTGIRQSGSTSNKLTGIKYAFHVARKSAPCMIHICLDDELCTVDDPELRHDEESRILNCIHEEMARFSHGSCHNESILHSIPTVFLVISTSNALSDSRILSSLSHDSIFLIPPDDLYSRQLWRDDNTYNKVKQHLVGMSANEICYVREQVKTLLRDEMNNITSFDEAINIIKKELESEPPIFEHKNSRKLSSNLIPDVYWDDIGGLKSVRDEIMDSIELPLAFPSLFKGNKRSGLLFFGPPGSGKTLVAKAIATECGIPFISIKGPELLGSYVGESEANIRDIFEVARKAAIGTSNNNRVGAAILFFDELDSLAPRRGDVGDSGGVMDRVVSTILGELDRPVSSDGRENNKECVLFVIGATNRPDLLDPSLLRPGRFDRIIYIGIQQSREDRISILASQMRKFTVEDGQDAFTISSRVIDSMPKSLTGADFAAIVRGAMMKSLKRLCDEADREIMVCNNQVESPNEKSIESLLDEWEPEKLVPIVTEEDLISSAMCVKPSVNEDDLMKYEQLNQRFTL